MRLAISTGSSATKRAFGRRGENFKNILTTSTQHRAVASASAFPLPSMNSGGYAESSYAYGKEWNPLPITAHLERVYYPEPGQQIKKGDWNISCGDLVEVT